jgi:drug/metabolite transporter (DMT)-like permease
MNLYRTSLVKALWATVLFGSVPACIRLMRMDSYALGVWRLSLAALGMSALLMALGRSPRTVLGAVRANWPVLAAVGLFFGLHWLTFFQSIKLGSASIGALGFSTCGVQLPLLGWLVGMGRPRASAMVGVALAMGGSALCLPWDAEEQGQVVGLLLGILSGTLYAFLPILHQKHAHLDHELRTWAQFTFALPVFLVMAPAADWSPISVRDVWLIIYLGLVVNLIGHYLWVQVSTELPLAWTSALGYLQLPTALAFSYAVVGEEPTLGTLGGAALIIGGNILALRGTPPRLEREAALNLGE